MGHNLWPITRGDSMILIFYVPPLATGQGHSLCDIVYRDILVDIIVYLYHIEKVWLGVPQKNMEKLGSPARSNSTDF